MRIGACLLLVELLGASPALAASVSNGKAAYSRNQVAEAERIFAEVIADKAASAEDRSEAERELARIAWLIDGNAHSALNHLKSAQSVGSKPCETAAMIARVLRQSNQADEALRRNDALIAPCPDAAKRDIIRTHLIGARLDLAAAHPARRATMLATAVEEGMKFSPDADVEAARVRLEAALMTRDARGALAAWKDYFWLEEADAPQALAHFGATSIFNSGLAPGARVADQLKLTELLMRAGFSIESRRFAALNQLSSKAGGDTVMKRLHAYWTMRDSIDPAMLQANRQMARGGKTAAVLKAVGKDLDRVVNASATALMSAANAKGKIDAALKANYGMVGTGRGETSGYPSIHMGHLVEDRELVISQYGKSAKIHYVSVDNMIANGFESWLWDGGPMVGGWQADGVIVQVRPAYVRSPLRSYTQTQDSVARRELVDRQNKRAGEDLAKLKARSVGTLDGLGDRLQLQVIDQIMAVARGRGSDEAGIRRAFLAEFTRANFDQSIEKHEGRHAIDEMLGVSKKSEQAVLEYQAKLSELALSDYPRMALENMNLNVEGDGPHDKAVAKLFDEIRRWIEAHPEEVMGYDPAIPALAQLDKLRDNQIREIARSLDPLPNGQSSPTKL